MWPWALTLVWGNMHGIMSKRRVCLAKNWPVHGLFLFLSHRWNMYICIHQLASDAANIFFNISLPLLILTSCDPCKDLFHAEALGFSPFGFSEPGGHCQTEYNNIIKGKIQSKQTNKQKNNCSISLKVSSSSRQTAARCQQLFTRKRESRSRSHGH